MQGTCQRPKNGDKRLEGGGKRREEKGEKKGEEKGDQQVPSSNPASPRMFSLSYFYSSRSRSKMYVHFDFPLALLHSEKTKKYKVSLFSRRKVKSARKVTGQILVVNLQQL